MTHPPAASPNPLNDAFYILTAHIICRTEEDAKAVMARVQATLEVERQAILDRPADPTIPVAAVSIFVVRLSRAAVRTLLLSLATLAASSPQVETGGTQAAGVINAIRRSQGAAGN